MTFDDVKGVDEAKDELQDVVDFLRDPDRFSCLGGKMPHGVLLVGEPGVGKTLLAKAVAGEAGVPFFQAAGSEFDEVFVGTGTIFVFLHPFFLLFFFPFLDAAKHLYKRVCPSVRQ